MAQIVSGKPWGFLGGGASVTPWPWAWTNQTDTSGFGSSTMSAPFSPAPYQWMVTDAGGTYYTPFSPPPPVGGVAVSNYGAGGTTSTVILATVVGAPARVRAAVCFTISLGGNYQAYAAGGTPVTNILADAVAINASLGSPNIHWIPKHNDQASFASSGGLDWQRLRQLHYGLKTLYPGKASNMSLWFRWQYTPRDATDAANQAADNVPLSLSGDASHLNGDDALLGYESGNHLLEIYGYSPHVESRQVDGFPFLPHTIEIAPLGGATHAAGDTLITVSIDPDGPDLTDCAVDFADSHPEFSIEIASLTTLTIKWATALYIADPYVVFRVRITRGNLARISVVQVYLADVTASGGARMCNLNKQAVVKEGIFGGVQDTQHFAFAVGIIPTPGSGWDWVSVTNPVDHSMIKNNTAGGGIDITTKLSNNMNMGCVLRNSAGGIVFNLDSPAAQGFKEANGFRWYFCSWDGVAGTYAVAVDGNAALVAGATGTIFGTVRLYPNTVDTMTRLFANNPTGAGNNGRCPMTVAALYMFAGASAPDFTVAVGGDRDLVRDPATKLPILNTVRGANAPLFVNGSRAIFACEGPAGNWGAGYDFANSNLATLADLWNGTDNLTVGTLMQTV